MSELTENWREIAINRDYEVSDLGRVRKKDSGRILSQFGGYKGRYNRVKLRAGGVEKNYVVHRLVCPAFHGPKPSPVHGVAHADGDGSNNQAQNLRWATAKENAADRKSHGRNSFKPGENNISAILTDEVVAAIRSVPKYYGYAKELSERFGIDVKYITTLRSKRIGRWAHIPFTYSSDR